MGSARNRIAMQARNVSEGWTRKAAALLAAVALAALVSFSAAPERAEATEFPDTPGHWVSGEGWLDWVTAQGLMSGYADTGRFGPDDDLTRAQAVTILYRYSLPDSAATTDPAQYAGNATSLPDNASGMYYTAAVNWAVESGVVTGYRNDAGEYYAFGPDDPVTREQLATILFRFAGLEGVGTVYDGSRYAAAPDAGTVSGWAREGAAWAFSKGVMTGYGDTGALAPQGRTSRAAMAKMSTVALRDVIGAVRDFDAFAEEAAAIVAAGPEPDAQAYAADPYYFCLLIVQDDGTAPDYAALGCTASARSADGLAVVQFATPDAARAAHEALSADGHVKWVEPDGYCSIDGELAVGAAGLSAAATTYNSWGAQAIGADKLADSLASKGGTLTVAVIDSGVSSHALLDPKLSSEGYDVLTHGPDFTDYNGHGTHVAGIIEDCTQGLDVRILPVRAFNALGRSDSSIVAIGIYYAVNHGAKILNLSCGGAHVDVLHDAVDYAISQGAVVVKSAGNKNTFAASSCPADMTSPIVVGAIDSSKVRASFSNFGSTLDVVAPGVDILSCMHTAYNGYRIDSGTSMAAPHVTAAAAMVLLQEPMLSPAEVEQKIEECATDLGTAGRDPHYGYGIPDLSKLVKVDPYHISTDYFEFDIPEYWHDKVTWEVTTTNSNFNTPLTRATVYNNSGTSYDDRLLWVDSYTVPNIKYGGGAWVGDVSGIPVKEYTHAGNRVTRISSKNPGMFGNDLNFGRPNNADAIANLLTGGQIASYDDAKNHTSQELYNIAKDYLTAAIVPTFVVKG